MAPTAPPKPAPVTSRMLENLQVITHGRPSVATAVCAGHLVKLGAQQVAAGNPATVGSVVLRDDRSPDCTLEWARGHHGDESVVQARSGLMLVHGRDAGMPRRLGLDVASVAAGIVASQGLLAALIARRRGISVAAVETSVLGGGLLFLLHHVAIATSGGDFPYRSSGSAGPPF